MLARIKLTVALRFYWRNDTQRKDTQYDHIQHNDTCKHKGLTCDTQYDHTQHKGLTGDTQHK